MAPVTCITPDHEIKYLRGVIRQVVPVVLVLSDPALVCRPVLVQVQNGLQSWVRELLCQLLSCWDAHCLGLLIAVEHQILLGVHTCKPNNPRSFATLLSCQIARRPSLLKAAGHRVHLQVHACKHGVLATEIPTGHAIASCSAHGVPLLEPAWSSSL